MDKVVISDLQQPSKIYYNPTSYGYEKKKMYALNIQYDRSKSQNNNQFLSVSEFQRLQVNFQNKSVKESKSTIDSIENQIEIYNKKKEQNLQQIKELQSKQINKNNNSKENSKLELKNMLRQQALQKLKEARQKDYPEVRYLTHCEISSKQYSILDEQIQQKQKIRQEQKDQQLKLDLQYSVLNLKEQKFYSQQEQQKKMKLKLNRTENEKQIQENYERKLKDKAQKEKEGQEMKQMFQKYDEERKTQYDVKFQTQELKQKHYRQSLLLQESRQYQVQQKLQEKSHQQIEKNDREQFLDSKAKFNQEILDKKEQKKREYDNLQEYLLNQIENNNQIQEAIDVLQAKRAQNAKEMQVREQEKLAKERQEELVRQLNEIRKNQIEEHELFAYNNLKIEKQLFSLQAESIQQQANKESKLETEQHNERLKTRDEIFKQIEQKQLNKQKQFQDKLGEGQNLKDNSNQYLQEIEQFRQNKIKNLLQVGVTEKYLSDLQRKKFR